ncbi:EDD domain protein, DegV family [Clostridium cavendishii DSM 21758]|uniref:EDD domain protein, DegV family n=1 Tax=Clostridium cavendishii DSM 21758 TaxID=1121302 RepID=A0A1M6PCJ9_9CLOT|nr:DegV family protein [Clostridium cavendishii]SHK05664.1 EDD domain protein, DegV family [Clostridium cavendishii DSM 21758]
MQKIALIADSACDLPQEILQNYNIKLLPLRIIYKDTEFLDKINVTPEEIYKRLDTEIPTTSLPSMECIEDTLVSLEQDGFTHVIVITISSGLSGTFNSVRLMAENHPKLQSYIFDSKILGIAEGVIVLETAKLIAKGKTYEEIITIIPKIQETVSIHYTLETLEYLKRGGRIGRVAGSIAEMLNIKPIIGVSDEGVYYTHAKARGRKQSLNKLKEILNENLKNHKCNVWIIEGGAMEDAKKFLDSVKDFENIENLDLSTISPALGVHTGPGLIGLGIQRLS